MAEPSASLKISTPSLHHADFPVIIAETRVANAEPNYGHSYSP